MIDCVRKEQMPAIPQSVQDFVLPDEYKVTDGLNPEPFLLYDNGPGPHSRIIAFATQGGVERFAGADTGFVDGNFKLAPKGFKQAYFIRVPYEQSSVTCVYAFLQNKTTAVYAELFDALIQKCEEMGLRVKIKTIVSDFEKGVLKAVRRTFGCDVHRQGCFFHLCQSTWRKINNLGLAERYRDPRNGDLRFFAAEMDALAFLPPDDVKEGMDYLKGRIPEGAELLFQYFDQTYVNGTSRLEAHTNPQGNPVIRTVRKEPMFPADLWNCNGATIDGGPRTNNVAEGFNNRVQTLVGKKTS